MSYNRGFGKWPVAIAAALPTNKAFQVVMLQVPRGRPLIIFLALLMISSASVSPESQLPPCPSSPNCVSSGAGGSNCIARWIMAGSGNKGPE